jgi:hypothetical protein
MRIAVSLALLALVAGGALADPAPSDGAATAALWLQDLRWAEKPTGNDFARNYPEDALDAGFGGHAVMHCRIEADGSMANCEITSEQPLGWGFGDATLRLARYFRAASKVPGKSLEGSMVIIPIGWSLRPGEPDYAQGEIGYVLTVIEKSASAKAKTLDCPIASNASRRCFAHEVTWEQSPLIGPVTAVLEANSKLGGHSRLSCTVSDKGQVVGCAPTSKATPGQATAMLALAGEFRILDKSRDGLDAFGMPIVIDFDWDELSRERSRLSKHR